MFSQNCEHAYTVKFVTINVNSKLSTNYSKGFIRKIMKEDIKLSYKKIKSRPYNINFKKVRLARILFSIKFTQIITNNTLLLNIDESSINRNLKTHYSWSLKGNKTEAKKSFIVGSASLIFGILSNGSSIEMITNGTINSLKFITFLKNLKEWLNKNKNFGFKETMLNMDNWSIHKSKSTINYLKKIKIQVMFLPAYSPILALIEEFYGILKLKMRKQWANIEVKLNHKENYFKFLKV